MVDVQLVHGERVKAAWSEGSEPPKTPAPIGATDCHHHIFDTRFEREGQPHPAPATVDDYILFKRRLGITRSIIVAPSNYGTDNSCLVDALERFGTASARGVVLVDPDVSDRELDRLHGVGVRGMRVYLAKNRIPSEAELQHMGERATERGWSLQFVGNRQREVLVEWRKSLFALKCPIVIDHFGWAPQPAGVKSQTARLLVQLLKERDSVVKLSGLYLSSAIGFPEYRDLDPLAKHLIEVAPDRIIWGTDWPHPVAGAQKPDGAMLFDRLAEWAPDPAIRHKILVETPDRLYWSN
jgi:predicted TIM-barrel fold metal-dependent hydrolase